MTMTAAATPKQPQNPLENHSILSPCDLEMKIG